MLHSCLHRPLLHTFLAGRCPLCCVVVHRQGKTQQGWEADPLHPEQHRLEVHEGLFPHHGKCRRSHQLLGDSGTNFVLSVWKRVWGQELWMGCLEVGVEGLSSQLPDYCKTRKKRRPPFSQRHLIICLLHTHLTSLHSSSKGNLPLPVFRVYIATLLLFRLLSI